MRSTKQRRQAKAKARQRIKNFTLAANFYNMRDRDLFLCAYATGVVTGAVLTVILYIFTYVK